MSNLFSQFSGFNPNKANELKYGDTISCACDYSLGNGIEADVDNDIINFEDSISLFAQNENKEYEFSFDDNDDNAGFDFEG